jgi:DNA (cytosine-5)-methyltransferase 1
MRALGKFYTHSFITNDLVDTIIRAMHFGKMSKVRIVDPFCGDGRLLVAFVKRAYQLKQANDVTWHIAAWDCDPEALKLARKALNDLIKKTNINAELDIRIKDSLLAGTGNEPLYDCVITNPPWETIKPDKRELIALTQKQQDAYKASLKEYDKKLAKTLPLSQPKIKFSGWGTNLSRCGLEMSLNLTAENGYCGIVLPSSLLNDQVSENLRKWMFDTSTMLALFHYPAEARLFEKVDQPCISMILRKTPCKCFTVRITKFNGKLDKISTEDISLTRRIISHLDDSFPVEFGQILLKKLAKWHGLNTFADLEGRKDNALWAGRELDETDYRAYLASKGRYLFLKGKMVDRFNLRIEPKRYVREDLVKIPPSADQLRIAWRDVSRRSQGRRMQASLVAPGIVTGNSLHVAYFKDGNEDRLNVLLGIMNSLPFEFQILSRLGTGHISLGIVRKAHIPNLDDKELVCDLSKLVKIASKTKSEKNELALEVRIAQAYGLDKYEYEELLGAFNKLHDCYKEKLLDGSLWKNPKYPNHNQISNGGIVTRPIKQKPVVENLIIPNHYSAKLSKMDMDIAISVPPGGNWKDVPKEIPSKRLETIRKSYEAGEGSRSTYYGRLRADKPSYTINTYFNRPGNGCHLHYDFAGKQHRVLSEREAARLQSFPDNFIFSGSHTSIAKQIGNAVPPLLAFQIARNLPFKGYFIDLFCGAGGMGLGFKWAGWSPIIGNDIEPSFLETYAANVHSEIICGDIRQSHISNELLSRCQGIRKASPTVPIIVLGGPPCQGFSTAGKKRSMDDDRNRLFYEYKKILKAVNPDLFLFENVTGIMNMENGSVFELIKRELHSCAQYLDTWKLSAENYAIPQRRTRVFLLGYSYGTEKLLPPTPLTSLESNETFFDSRGNAISANDALSDLPPLSQGEIGSMKDYVASPQNAYQKFMRSIITAEEYLEEIAAFKAAFA